MKRSLQILIGSALTLGGTIGYVTNTSFSSSEFTQIVIPFKSEKKFQYEWLKQENTLLLQFPSVSPKELEPFNNYDERLVRRLVVKDLGPAGTEIRLVLRDRDVRALVSSFKDPFRVSVDLFDKNFSPAKDPVTGLPISDAGSVSASGSDKAVLLQPHADSTPNTATSKEDSPSKRRLLQALPEEVNSPNELKVALSKIAPGTGKGWTEYPPYVYRTQLAPYEGREAPDKETSPWQAQAVKTTSAMADYASKLYDFGHEGRALLAYQQVLLKEPGVFEKDPIHLWKFAECNLGQGNFQLADGYYSALLDKHPSHAMAQYARLRKLDVAAIKAIERRDDSVFKKLATQLSQVDNKKSGEIAAQVEIRKAWWNDSKANQARNADLPVVAEEIQRRLESVLPNVESQRTAFLASSLIANRMVQPDTNWEESYAGWLNGYFDKFKGPATEPTREKISVATRTKISAEIKNAFQAGKYVQVAKAFENLPTPMKSIRKDPAISWSIAESYRALGQNEKAIPFYQTAAAVPASIDKFKSQFWVASLAGNAALDLAASKGDQARIRSLQNASQTADTEMGNTWSKLKSDEKAQILTGMSDVIENNVASELKSKTPAKILLEKWTSSLTVNPPKMSTQNGTNPTDEPGNFSPSAGTVRVLDDLGKKFAELGMQAERREALQLMRFIKPSSLEQDKTAQKIWSDQMLSLAEEHRKANEFLQAGELYSLVGDGATANENRAEAYYKGGLLLYRAGKKEEAIKILEKAKSDPNNLFYSKLATERLDQLQAH